MTANPDSTLAKTADVVLALPQAREACPHNLAPTTSSLMQLALGDALAIALLESRGFTALDFGLPASRRQARRAAQDWCATSCIPAPRCRWRRSAPRCPMRSWK